MRLYALLPRLATVATLGLFVACSESPTRESAQKPVPSPTEPPAVVPVAVSCLEWCEVTDRRTLLETGSVHPDSTLIPAFLAGFDAATDAGALLQLRVDEDDAWWSAVGDGPGVIVTTSYWTQEISLAALRQGPVAISLPVEERLGVSLAYPHQLRDRAPHVPTLSVRFAEARIFRSRRPYAPGDGGAVGLAAATAGGFACAIPLPGSVCNVSGSVSPTPYTFLPSAWGVTGFTSNGSSDPSVPMTITLSGLVDEFGIWVHDPDFDGNWVIAYDDQMTPLDSAAVPYDGAPGVPNFTSEEITVTGPGIKYIKLQPAPLDYVGYGEAGFPEPDTLVVKCAPLFPFRGQTTTCTAQSASGSGTLAITQWRFTSTSPALDSADIVEATTDTFWSGTAVRAGTVRAIGTVNGVVDTGEGDLAVRSRKWGADTVEWSVVNLGQGALPDPPDTLGDLGRTRLGAAVRDNNWSGPPTIGIVQSGPNESLLYFLRLPMVAAGSTMVNYTALSSGGVFWGWHPLKDAGGTCGKGSVTAFIAPTEQHEGTQLEVHSHTWTLRDQMNKTSSKIALEDVSAQTVQTFLNIVDQAALPLLVLAVKTASDSGKYPEAIVKPVPWHCTFIW